ncbi:aminoglycoside phosphotransferase family protein [Serinicoccus kebangsaanensis]|uniref:aminoglycoside phosphotransferase family protein n=1 Tax=Serinicoccus kebangsaanensis TaxID=2602069 RepID=UPI00178C2FE3|nr:aminoglycoside phosphotransferase family protein [Serinicoccus kebangsaanensis]
MEQSEVVALARARPWADQDWAAPLLDSFPDVLARTVDHWGLVIERAHLDGVGLPVLEVRRGEHPAAVKFDDAGTDLTQQVRVMRAAEGRGYCRLLDHAEHIGSALLERLGPSLARTTPDGVAQVEVLVDLLEQAWELPLSVADDEQLGEKASQLLAIVETEVADGGWVNGHTPAFTHAATLARALVEQPLTDRVVVHGDAHSLNVLERPGVGHAFIDPDGFLCEREYDAGVALRDLMAELESLARTESPATVRDWHRSQVDRVSARLELEADRVSAWAFVERVSTGVWLHRLGFLDEAERWLRSADLLTP